MPEHDFSGILRDRQQVQEFAAEARSFAEETADNANAKEGAADAINSIAAALELFASITQNVIGDPAKAGEVPNADNNTASEGAAAKEENEGTPEQGGDQEADIGEAPKENEGKADQAAAA